MRPQSHDGFTLIELMMVVVIIGLLAAIIVPKFQSSRGRAFLATMKADLRNLTGAQEAYVSDFQSYYSGPVPAAGFNFAPSSGVTITLSGVVPGGWRAVATHTQTTRTCTVFVGLATALPPATVEGAPTCT